MMIVVENVAVAMNNTDTIDFRISACVVFFAARVLTNSYLEQNEVSNMIHYIIFNVTITMIINSTLLSKRAKMKLYQ